jgi:hypothetical protein
VVSPQARPDRDDELLVLRSLAELEELVGEQDDLYLRYAPSSSPARTSRDWESGLQLPGVSVNPLTPESWWTRPIADWIARQICTYVHLHDRSDDRRPYVMHGEVVGRGPDNEPLLDPAVPVAVLTESMIREAKQRYEREFAVGRESIDASG